MAPTPLSDEARERLASLGYVSAVTPPPSARPGTCRPRSQAHGGALRAAARRQPRAGERTRRTRPRDRRARCCARTGQRVRAPAARARGAGAGQEPRGHRRVRGVSRRWCPAAPTRITGPRWRALRLGDRAAGAGGRGSGARARPAAHGGHLAPRRPAVLERAGRTRASRRCGRRWRRIPRTRRWRSNSPICWPTRSASTRRSRIYRRALAARPGDGRALTGLACCWRPPTAWTSRVEQLTRALEVDQRDDEARLARADVLVKLGRAAGGSRRLRKASARGDATGTSAARLKRLAS